jgi:DNA-binding MarR family transcriptional regulator
MRAYFERVAVEAGVDLPINECWALVQIRRGYSSPGVLSERSGAAPAAVQSTLADLAQKGLVTVPAADTDAPFELTDSGVAIADTLLASVRDRLDKLLDGWSPERYTDLSNLLNEFATEVMPTHEPLTA